MEIKETDTLWINSLIGLLLLGNVTSAVAADGNSSNEEFRKLY